MRSRESWRAGFGRRCRTLDQALLAELLARGRTLAEIPAEDVPSHSLDSEEFRIRLGRIACGYDGGQVDLNNPDESVPE
jgi:hypothetical protein